MLVSKETVVASRNLIYIGILSLALSVSPDYSWSANSDVKHDSTAKMDPDDALAALRQADKDNDPKAREIKGLENEVRMLRDQLAQMQAEKLELENRVNQLQMQNAKLALTVTVLEQSAEGDQVNQLATLTPVDQPSLRLLQQNPQRWTERVELVVRGEVAHSKPAGHHRLPIETPWVAVNLIDAGGDTLPALEAIGMRHSIVEHLEGMRLRGVTVPLKVTGKFQRAVPGMSLEFVIHDWALVKGDSETNEATVDQIREAETR